MTRLIVTLTLALGFLCSLVHAQETAEPDSTPQRDIEVPAAQTLRLSSASYGGLIREEGDRYTLYLLRTDLHPVAKGWAQIGTSIADLRLRPTQVKVTWLPVSFYLVPLRLTDQFTKTGAAKIIETSTVSTERPEEHIEVTVTRRQRETVTAPEATTSFTYTKFAMYGVISANANHIFDLQASPLRTENDRAGIGFVWARAKDIPDGAAFDLAHAPSYGTTVPNAAVKVKSHGLEITRSIDRGPTTWYFTLVKFFQQ